MPSNPERTRCHRNLWVIYDLTYTGDSLDGVFEEIERPRDKCPGFFQYESGFAPDQHFQRRDEKQREKLQWRIAILGFGGALIGAIVGSRLHELVSWVAELWHNVTSR
jgi:hypothetical protein